MSEESELRITIDPDEPEALPDVPVKAEPKNERAAEIAKTVDPADELKAQVEKAQSDREAERKRREDAERRAAQLEREAQEANQRATASDFSTITTALEAAQAEVEQAKRDIRSAKAAGDTDAELDAIDRLTTAKTQALRLDEAKADAEARKKAPPAKRQEQSSDPIEAYVSNRTEPTANWIRNHPDYVTDSRKNTKLTAAHYDAVAEGYVPDSKRYFDHIEKYLGLVKEADVDEEPVAKPVPKRAQAAPVAPTAAVANGGTAPSGNEVRLSAAEARAATDGTHVYNWDDPKGKYKKGDPIGIEEFARRKLAMQKQGRYDRSFSES